MVGGVHRGTVGGGRGERGGAPGFTRGVRGVGSGGARGEGGAKLPTAAPPRNRAKEGDTQKKINPQPKDSEQLKLLI